MMAWSAVATATMLFVVGVASLPAIVHPLSRELLPPRVDSDSTLATELMPPPEDKPAKEEIPFTLFLINVYAVKNFSAEDSNDVLHNDVITEVSEDVAEPLAMFLLIVEADNETEPVSLDEVAKDLVDEGFTIEKIRKDGETRIIKVDLDSVESSSLEGNTKTKTEEVAEESASEVEYSGKLMKVRRRRSICLGCDVDAIRAKRHLHKHRHEPCFGGCGGGYYPEPTYPRPQPVYPRPQPVYLQPQPYYPQPCSTCGNNGGGYNSGGGNAFASASAQASASSYGGY